MPARVKRAKPKKKVARRKPVPRDKTWYCTADPNEMYETYPVQGLANAQKEVKVMMENDYTREITIFKLVPIKKYTLTVKEENI